MSSHLRTITDYELFIYSLPDQFSSIHRSTLVVIRKGATMLRVEGELFFANDISVVVRERLLFDRLPGVIDWYGYELWQREGKLWWYDSQPHPNEPALQQNHPHHKHIPPDIKHHRVAALQMSFNVPNLEHIIREIESLLEAE